MFKIGITGGIGSGKSIVCEVFKQLGIPVYNTDFEAKKLLDNNIGIKDKILEKFGNEFFVENKINRKKLADLIFSDANALTDLKKV